MPNLKIKFWGVRGSLPRPSKTTIKFGGNTPCLELRYGNELIICDAGTGLFDLGKSLPSKIDATILFSHYHWDHIIGLPFFSPIYNKGSKLRIIGRRGLKRALNNLLNAPNFPIGLSDLHAKIRLNEKREEHFMIGHISIETFEVNHPNGAFGYSFILPNGKKMVFISDNSPAKNNLYLINKIVDADILIHDAQYLPKEYLNKKHFGHSPWQYVLDLAIKANIKQVILFHHDPARTDKELKVIEYSARRLAKKIGLKTKVLAAYEGLILTL